MSDKIFICSDLDRTLLPNGPATESPQARPLLRRLAARKDVTLAYVSGRNRALLQAAIANYNIPVPRYAVGDVGTSIYETKGGEWKLRKDWSRAIAGDWDGKANREIVAMLDGIPELRLQEPENQNTCKVCYYAPPGTDRDNLLDRVRKRLEAENVRPALIWSVDEERQTGLLDILPAGATKAHAVRFLMSASGFNEENTVFAGDSGNDMPVLTSGLQAVLVRNAGEDVRSEALQRVAAKGLQDRLYLPEGGFLGMNGNYSAGVLEGVAHFFPRLRDALDRMLPAALG